MHYGLVLLFDADLLAELAERIKLATHAEEQHAFFVAGEVNVRSQDVIDHEALVDRRLSPRRPALGLASNLFSRTRRRFEMASLSQRSEIAAG